MIRTKIRMMIRILFLAVLLSLTGCLHPRPSTLVIPAHCLTVSIQSFTRPCEERFDGNIVCDGVVIKANCVAPGPHPPDK